MPRRKTREENISDIIKVHGNKYDLSEFNTNTVAEKGVVICPTHGRFQISANNLKSGKGCLECSKERTSKALMCSQQDFEAAVKIAHPHSDYICVGEYLGDSKKITFKCPKHGVWNPIAGNIKRGSGCPKCGRIKISQKKTKLKSEVVKDLDKVHKGKLKFPGEYRGSGKPFKTVCENEHVTHPSPGNLLQGTGCAKCSTSAENYAENHEKATQDISIRGDFSEPRLIEGRNYRPDVYYPEQKLCVDFNGAYWHSEKSRTNSAMRDRARAYRAAGFKYLTFFWEQTYKHNNSYLSIIKHNLGLTERRIFARKCKVVHGDFRFLFKENHLLGPPIGKFCIGLEYEDELVCAGSFQKWNNQQWNMTRWCNLMDTQVIGGFRKVLSKFDRQGLPLVTFSDNMISEGSVYERAGFEMSKELPPDYGYIKSGESIINKRFFRHSNMPKIKGFKYDKNMTEHENTLANGYFRVYDAGKKRWILN